MLICHYTSILLFLKTHQGSEMCVRMIMWRCCHVWDHGLWPWKGGTCVITGQTSKCACPRGLTSRRGLVEVIKAQLWTQAGAALSITAVNHHWPRNRSAAGVRTLTPGAPRGVRKSRASTWTLLADGKMRWSDWLFNFIDTKVFFYWNLWHRNKDFKRRFCWRDIRLTCKHRQSLLFLKLYPDTTRVHIYSFRDVFPFCTLQSD